MHLVPGGIVGPPSNKGYEYGNRSPGWGLGVRLTTPTPKKLSVRKPEVTSDLRFRGDPLWRRRSALGYSANEEENYYLEKINK